jgi:hypothetical protein
VEGLVATAAIHRLSQDLLVQVLVHTLPLGGQLQHDKHLIARIFSVDHTLHVGPESLQILLVGGAARQKLCHFIDERRHSRHGRQYVLERRGRHELEEQS